MNMSVMEPARVSHYRLVELLGRGAMGEVWKAEDTQLPRTVALKLLPAHLAADREAAERLLREAQAAASVDHPGVVAVYEAGFFGARPYLVMQRVEGETLERRLARGPLPPAEALAIARDLADALAEVHALGIVHRDLKPDNVVLTSRGPKILDFGLASLRDSPKLTMADTLLGTPRFLSPEQVKGLPCDSRADLWALGVMLYQMLTGAPPFGGISLEALSYQILNHAPEAPSRVRPKIPAEADYLVLKLLRKDPAKRYARAEDLIADLDSLLAPAEAPASAESKIPRLAVIPFEVMSSSADDSYLASGLAEDLIVDLTRLGGLHVASRAEVMPYRDRIVPPRTLARELNADYVLLGSVRHAGNRARISAQLVNAADGNSLWADRFDRTLEDLFDVQAEVSRKIVEALRLALSPGEREMLDRAPTRNAEAYALYLQARDLIDRTIETNRQAEKLLGRALELDDRFPLALAAMGETHAIRGMRWWSSIPEAAEPAEGYAQRALALEPDLVDAHLVLARVHRMRGDAAALGESLERILALDPDHSEALLYAGWSYLSRGLPEKARPILERAARNSGAYMAADFLAACYETLGREADKQRARAMTMEYAVEYARRHPGREGAHARSVVATQLVHQGRGEEGLEQVRRALADEPDDGRLHYNAACAYARMGRTDDAIRELEEGTRNLSSYIHDWVLLDPDLENVRDHPEFVRMFGRPPEKGEAPA